MSNIKYWFELEDRFLTPFWAINVTNNKKISIESNDKLLLKNQSGSWTAPKSLLKMHPKLIGANVILYYYKNNRKESIIYFGKIRKAIVNGKTKDDRDRWLLTAEKPWEVLGTSNQTFSNFLTGFRLSSNATSVWIDPYDESVASNLEIDDLGLTEPQLGSTRIVPVAQRVGHHIFAKAVHKSWDGKCSLTGLKAPRLLQAAHIVPWESANQLDKLSEHNGLLLCAHLHTLFDEHLLSFSSAGELLIDSSLSKGVNDLILSTKNNALRRVPTKEQQDFLEQHRTIALTKNRNLLRAN